MKWGDRSRIEMTGYYNGPRYMNIEEAAKSISDDLGDLDDQPASSYFDKKTFKVTIIIEKV